jgi:hypothetical protein
MAKTDELLTTIGMTCPDCRQFSDIEFHRELVTYSVPFLTLKKTSGITCKCHACGKSFKYSNPDKLYRYMNKSGKPYQRSFFVNNLMALAIPVIAVIAIIAIVSAIAQIAAPILNPADTGPDALENTPTPLKLYSFSVDAANQTCYASFQLSDNSTPVDIEALNVSIRKNGNLTNMKIWRYGNDSISWINASHVGTMMGRDDKAQVTLNLSCYHFNSTDKVELLFQIFDYTPYVHLYTMPNLTDSKNNTTVMNASAKNGTPIAILSGHVYLNNLSSPRMLLTIGGNKKPLSIVTDNTGYYSISLTPNKSYTITASDPDIAGLKSYKTTVKLVNNTTLDIWLHT